jgi:DNA-binding CsgD family transcriptional regulator
MTSRLKEAAISQLSLSLQRALTVRDVMRSYIDVVGAAVPAKAYGVYYFDPDAEAPSTLLFDGQGVPDKFFADYEECGRSADPVFAAAIDANGPIDDSRLPRAANWESSPVYDVLRGNGFGHSLEAPLFVEDHLIGTVNFARADDDPAFDRSDLRTIGSFLPHVEIALERALRYALGFERATMLEVALHRLDHAVIVSSLEGDVLFANRVAERMRLDQVRGRMLSQLLEQNRADLTDGRRTALAVARPNRSDRLEEGSEVLSLKSVVVSGDKDAIVSFGYRRSMTTQAPVEQTPLSARQREIAALVAEGLTNREIADRVFVSENTIKQHLKRMFDKLDVRSRAELTQAIWQAGSSNSAG